jgi:hypothetical protein
MADSLDRLITTGAQDEIGKADTANQFGVAQTPFHTHNGADSQRVSFSNLTDRLTLQTITLAGITPATAGNYGMFFIAPFPVRFVSAAEVHATAGTDGSAVTVQIEKLTSTTVPGSGTVLLLAGFNMKGAINTVQYGTLAAASKKTFYLLKGDRLALKLTGTPTAIANAVFTVGLLY